MLRLQLFEIFIKISIYVVLSMLLAIMFCVFCSLLYHFVLSLFESTFILSTHYATP